MAWTYNVNQTYATVALAIYNLKAQLKGLGVPWTVPRSSDGTTYNSSGDQISSGGSGAGGLANNFAWFVIQQPGSTRQWCFQRSNTSNVNWRVKVSGSAGFSGGSPSSTQTPSATDEIVLLGGGTDAAPTFAALTTGADGSNRTHMVLGSSSEQYSWVIWFMSTGTTTVQGLVMHDGMQSNSYVASDPDPYVYYMGSATATPLSGLQNLFSGASKAYLGSVLAANAVSVGLPLYGATAGTNAFPGGVGVSPVSSKDVAVPQMWFRASNQTAPVGFKGFSSIILAGSVSRTNMDTLTVLSTRDKVYIQGYWLPWSGAVPTL